jgi:hypothetical protein
LVLFAWSSHRANAEGAPPLLVTPHERYTALGPDDASRRSACRELFRDALSTESIDRIRHANNTNDTLGNDRFRNQVEAMLGRRNDHCRFGENFRPVLPEWRGTLVKSGATFCRSRLACSAHMSYKGVVKTITVRLPDPLVAELEDEARERRMSKSDVVRERLTSRPRARAALSAIADLVGSVEGLPRDLSAARKRYLKTTGYGRRRPR